MLQGLEAATICVDDMDEWLRIFNVKLRHMREDIESVRAYTLQVRNNFPSTSCFVIVIAVLAEIMVHLFSFLCFFVKARQFMH